MGYQFDGPAKLIILTAGTTAVEVEELYSRWVDWVTLSDNSKYLPAIRFVGGDAISATKNLGITFFLINGWRIRPDEANHTLRVAGNLYTDPSGFSPFVATVGAFNVMIEMTVSSLVDSTLAQISEIEQSAFNGMVHIDAANSTGQAAAGTAYPIGTHGKPCNNLVDAQTIAVQRGLTALHVMGDLTLGSTTNLTEYHIYGEGATLNATRTKITFTSGNVTTGAHFHNCRITGPQGGETNYHECIIDGLSNAHCHYERCGFVMPAAQVYTLQASNTIGLGHITDLHDCYGDEGTAIVDRNGTRLNQRYMNYRGNITFINQNRATESGAVWINMQGGVLTIDTSCTKGVFYVTGNCIVVNNANGATVDTSGVVATAVGGIDYAALAQAILAAAQATPIHSNVKQVNGTSLAGTGGNGDPWRPAA